jgi:hypothetical protein
VFKPVEEKRLLRVTYNLHKDSKVITVEEQPPQPSLYSFSFKEKLIDEPLRKAQNIATGTLASSVAEINGEQSSSEENMEMEDVERTFITS